MCSCIHPYERSPHSVEEFHLNPGRRRRLRVAGDQDDPMLTATSKDSPIAPALIRAARRNGQTGDALWKLKARVPDETTNIQWARQLERFRRACGRLAFWSETHTKIIAGACARKRNACVATCTSAPPTTTPKTSGLLHRHRPLPLGPSGTRPGTWWNCFNYLTGFSKQRASGGFLAPCHPAARGMEALTSGRSAMPCAGGGGGAIRAKMNCAWWIPGIPLPCLYGSLPGVAPDRSADPSPFGICVACGQGGRVQRQHPGAEHHRAAS